MHTGPFLSEAARRLRPVLPLAQILAGFVALALVLRLVDRGGIVPLLREAEVAPIVLAVLAVQVQILVSALRWRFTAGRLSQPMTIGRAVAEYYLATLLNQILPGAVAGDALRVLRQSQGSVGEKRVRRAAQAVALERLSGQLVLLAAALAGVLFGPSVFGLDLPGGAIAVVLAALLLATVVLATLLALTKGRTAAFLARTRPVLEATFLQGGALLVQLASSFTVVGAYLAAFALAGAAVGAPLGPAAALLLVPLVLLSMLLPVSVGGWGVREGAAAAILPVAGLTPQAAVAASLAYGLASLVGALPGLLVILRGALRRRAQASS